MGLYPLYNEMLYKVGSYARHNAKPRMCNGKRAHSLVTPSISLKFNARGVIHLAHIKPTTLGRSGFRNWALNLHADSTPDALKLICWHFVPHLLYQLAIGVIGLLLSSSRWKHWAQYCIRLFARIA